jgi:CIC family chloride channel protein
MGIAAAIGASLHAPIAGVFLARELILRRQRLSSLGPVAIAAASGWLMSMWLMGGKPVIAIPTPGDVPVLAHLAAIVALPVLIAAAYACNVAWTRAPIFAAAVAGRVRMPLWLLPLPGGLARGVIALAFPQVLGIGYEPLASGLNGNYGAELLPVLALAKRCATESRPCRLVHRQVDTRHRA